MDQALSQKSCKLTFLCLEIELEPNSSTCLKICSHILLRFDTSRNILQTKFFQRTTRIFSCFRSLPIPVTSFNDYVCGNPQHCLIKIVRIHHDDVGKAVDDFLALVKRYASLICRLMESLIKGCLEQSLNKFVLNTEGAIF